MFISMVTEVKEEVFEDFSFQFRKIITRYRRIGYNLNVMRQSACLVFKSSSNDPYRHDTQVSVTKSKDE